jgi:hypothetical protein
MTGFHPTKTFRLLSADVRCWPEAARLLSGGQRSKADIGVDGRFDNFRPKGEMRT